MVQTSIEEIGEKIKSGLSWDKVAENLPAIAVLALGLYILDKSVDVSSKVKILTQGSRKLNQAEIFEGIDTIGDHIQLFDSILKVFKIELPQTDLDKIADFLQNVGTSGKYISQFLDILKGKFGSFSFGSGAGSTSGNI